MTVLFPLEIKHREFHSKIFLASQILKNSKFDVCIGEKNKIYNLFKHNDYMYLLSKGGPKPGFRFKKKEFKKNCLGILDEEGPILNLDKNERQTRLHNYIIKNIDDYFVWGRQDLKIISKLKKNPKKLSMFGHPKFDLLKKENYSFYEKDIIKIKKKYKKFIFVSSSFPVDQIMKTKSFNKFRYHNFQMGKDKKKAKEKFNQYLKNEEENYLQLIDLLIEFAKKNAKINIIFRPHPRQDIKLVKKRFANKPKNIFIIYENVITPWIISCELFIHSGCASFLEASILKKKIICFIKNKGIRKKNLFQIFGQYFNDKNKCLKHINNNIKNFKFKRSKLPKSIIENSLKKSFSKKFISFLNKNYKNLLRPIKTGYKNNSDFNNKLNKIKINLKKIILKNDYTAHAAFLLNASNILSYDYKQKKFPGIDKKEIKDYLFRGNFSLKKKVQILELSKDLFYLKNKSNNVLDHKTEMSNL